MFFTYWSNVSADFPEPGVIDPRTGLPTGQYAEVRQGQQPRRAHSVSSSPLRGRGASSTTARSLRVRWRGLRALRSTSRAARAITVGLVRLRRLQLRDARESRLPRDGLDEGSAQLRGASARSGSTWPVAGGSACAPFACGRIRSPSGLLYVRPPELSSGSRKPMPAGPHGAEAVYGRVRSNVAHWHLVDSAWSDVRASKCDLARVPFGLQAGRARGVRLDGFWLCVSRARDQRSAQEWSGRIVNRCRTKLGHY